MKKVITVFAFALISTLSYGQLIFNEVLYDPPSGTAGDANGDGTRDPLEDEFIELVNTSGANFDLSGFEVYDKKAMSDSVARHVFPIGTVLGPDSAIVVFGGGMPTGTFGGATVQTASGGELNMTNSGDSIVIYDANGMFVLDFDIEPLSNNPNESYTRFPDITGNFIQHADTTAILFSPGTYIDGTTPFMPMSGVGIDEVLQSQFSVYPNPVNSIFNIETVLKVDQVVIYSAAGQVVLIEKEEVSAIDISALPSGVYLVRIESSSGTAIKQIIKH